MKFLFYDQDHHLNPTLPMKEYAPTDQAYDQHAVDLAKASKIPSITPQPKPATGEQEDHPPYFPHRNMEPERIGPSPYPPDPTPTDEWTVEYVIMELGVNTYWKARDITEAHKAALAAEKDRVTRILTLKMDEYRREVAQLREQLSAEQALSRGRMQQIEQHQQELIDLRDQLAAEKSLRETAQSNAELWHEEIMKADKQLAAEREWSLELEAKFNKIQNQLAAERERSQKLHGQQWDLFREIKQLREKVQTLQAFLQRCADHMICGSNIADTPLPTMEEWKAALAKVKEGN